MIDLFSCFIRFLILLRQAPDADVLIVLVAEEEQLASMYRDFKEFPVLEKDTRNYSKETLNYFMERASSEDEFNRLQNIDTSLYFENFDREFIFCRLLAEQGADSIYILNRIEVLEKLVDGFYLGFFLYCDSYILSFSFEQIFRQQGCDFYRGKIN